MDSLSPNIFVRDMPQTIEFYTKLGFEITMKFPENKEAQWARMACGNVVFMFQTFQSLGEELPMIKREGAGALLFYIKMKHIQSFFDKVKDDTSVIRGLENTFYGTREFLIQDNNGHVLTFSEDI